VLLAGIYLFRQQRLLVSPLAVPWLLRDHAGRSDHRQPVDRLDAAGLQVLLAMI
jgi:hypothetical protein